MRKGDPLSFHGPAAMQTFFFWLGLFMCKTYTSCVLIFITNNLLFSLKVQQLSEKLFYLQLLKKREDILEKKKVELMNQRSIFLKIFSDTKRKMIEEEENFMKEITDFNNEYGLTCNRELLIRKKAKTEICDLETQANILKNEMESMECENVQLNALQLQKNELKQDLFTLQSKLKEQLREAEDITKCLEAEKVKVSEKPQTDIECLRIKKELEIYKGDDLENVCEALQTEIEFLRYKLCQKNLKVAKLV
uniref:Coiled-coil domain-containing protein 172 n=1 Tax=Chrysemys picta bellii TaxID=8478 RepID=A0A8C3F569_CHRPI